MKSRDDINDDDVFAAMSVIPVLPLTAGSIAGEMMIAGDGRAIVPALRRLEAQNRIVRVSNEDVAPCYRWSGRTLWQLSSKETEHVVAAWNELCKHDAS